MIRFVSLVLLAFLVFVASAARAEDGPAESTPAEKAARSTMVPIDQIQTLTIPEDDVTFDEDIIGLPIVRVEVRVQGTRWASKPTITSVKFGEKLTAETARRAMRELGDTGGFAKLAAEAERAGSGAVLRIIAVPARIVAAVQLDGGALERAATLRAANLVVGEEITERELDAIPGRVQDFYAERGFPAATVTVRAAELDDPGTVLVVVNVVPGEPRTVAQRIFVIEPDYDAHVKDLKFDYKVDAGARFDESALVDADRALAQALREAGFYRAHVQHSRKDKDGFSYLYIYVDSGPKLVPIFEGSRTFDSEQLTDALQIDKGAVGSLDELAAKLTTYYVRHGFMDAIVTPTPRPNKDPGLEYVAFDIRENERVEVERRVFVCLANEVDPDDVGREIDAVLETELPVETFISAPDPALVDSMLSTHAVTGSRPATLELAPAVVYTEDAYAKALKRVREIFLSQGYLNAVVGPVTVVRPTCDPLSLPGECREQPIEPLQGTCASTDAGLPLPEPAAPSSVRCIPDPDKGIRCSPRITLRIPINLGPVTRVWQIAFTGNKAVSEKDLANAATIPAGEPLSLDALEEAKARILGYYQDRGYAYVEVTSNIELSPDRTRALVRFDVEERDIVFIEDIDVEGATRTDLDLIRRRVGIAKGEVFSRSKLRTAEERLATLGTFSSVSVALSEPEVVRQSKRLVVRVIEYPSQYIDPKVGFSTGEGLRFAFEYGHRNIASLGIALTLRIQLSYLFDFMILDRDVEKNLGPLPASQRLERRNSVRVSFPDIGAGPLLTLDIEGIDVRDNQRDFGLSRQAIVPTFTFRPLREFVGTFSASIELNDEKIFSGDSVDQAILKNPTLAQLLRFPDGTTVAAAQRLTVSWDRRDVPFNATTGTLVAVELEHVNAFPADPDDPETDPLVSHFLRISGRVAGYLRLTKSGVALALSMAVGANVQLASGSRTYPDRLFYLGGFDSLRSFLAYSVVPEDVAQQIINPPANQPDEERLKIEDVAIRGGDLSINPRIELRVPLSETFGIGIFADAGNLWVSPSNFIDNFALRFALGAGLRIGTPVGPLAFDYGFNPDPRKPLEEDIGALHFSIGLF
ncbi:MAG: POTRA domain-containing protein [Polyangiaceae bacterium]